ncbi:MAG TPA: cytochrome c [Solirubrobacteraceae bacterium]|jgi:mono/diheme cytochrome c family protein
MAALLFIGFWVLLGITFAYVGIRGGAGEARESLHRQSPRARHIAAGLFAVAFVGLGVAVPAVFLIGNHDNASAKFNGVKLDSDDSKGRDIFQIRCAGCHTLAAAHADGTVGPNLDDLKPPKSLVLDAIEHGRLRGNGNMPADIVQGQDAQNVADFVSKVAGK